SGKSGRTAPISRRQRLTVLPSHFASQYLRESRRLKLDCPARPVDRKPPAERAKSRGKRQNFALDAVNRKRAHPRARSNVVELEPKSENVVKRQICWTQGEQEPPIRLFPIQDVVDVEHQVRSTLFFFD